MVCSRSVINRSTPPSWPTTAPIDGSNKNALKNSSPSINVSSMIGMVIVLLVSPTPKVNVPVVVVKSMSDWANTPAVKKRTVLPPPTPFVRVTVRVTTPAFSLTVTVGWENWNVSGPLISAPAENSEVSLVVLSVAVAVMNWPVGVAVPVFTIKLPLPLPSVATAVEPINV